NDEDTLKLLNTNPFEDEPPKKVRVLRYRYEYTSPEERAGTGEWWNRELVGVYVDASSLEELRRRGGRRRSRIL
ncbi:MAG: lipase maturation factor family protein, partial [Halobacteria archaeon]|nr:lipase maturation factor family protein [Halobacteria archaeon]